MAASFREKKGHEYALRAFAAARQRLSPDPRQPRVELRLIGDGDMPVIAATTCMASSS